MILGTGIDIIAVERIRDAIARHGKHFLDHVFTPEEQKRAPRGEGQYAYFAGRWAAKEAVAKALGTGIGAECAWTDIDIRADTAGKPSPTLRNAAENTRKNIGASRLHVSISHERTHACAMAVVEGPGGAS
jgi:holo-[acyl-carrier protein] synthase